MLVGAAKLVDRDMATRLEGSAAPVLDKAGIEDATLLNLFVGATKLVEAARVAAALPVLDTLEEATELAGEFFGSTTGSMLAAVVEAILVEVQVMS